MGYIARAIITVVLFSLVMWLVAVGLKVTLLPASDQLAEWLGEGPTLALIAAVFLAIGIPSYLTSARAAKARRSDRSF
ncbi:hypothetical protein [Methylobacterium sp. A54F]